MDLGKHSEAEALFKQAVKLTTPNMLAFRIKGDWSSATPLFERAGLLYRVRAPPLPDAGSRQAA